MLKTPAEVQRESRDRKITKAYIALIEKGAKKHAAQLAVVKKFGIARSTMYRINNRVNHGKSI